uniref:Osmosensitive K+ channel histidine kinase KdpD n=1 Tax=uncultured bacterium A1Q1_fos_499 TaxID=1256578 RepID=M0QSB6_9BACT|nr:osmosensitive K+ channel histidine kinase KdpD [uncultured bacterium A1Q1_fos_499]
MSDGRPSPERLLERWRLEEGPQERGRLKLFFGAVAGVGKTFAMLQAAHELAGRGIDVVIGWVETHGRKDTEALLAGLERLPSRTLTHRGSEIAEFDLDGALARRPRVLLVDELAHSNVPGSRHTKRWQDVDELLAAGIDVFTTLNVQHIESLNDVVARVTGVAVRETVPDAVLDRADAVELVDLPPEELIKRLQEGKVYLGEQAERALERFFTEGNLIALRELALHKTAERVDAQMQAWRERHEVAETWPIAERILVGVGPAPSSARLVRGAKRLAERLRAQWIVAWVELPEDARLSQEDRDRVWQTLRRAEELGAETVQLAGSDAARELLAFARQRNVSKIVVGKPHGARWRELLFGSVRERLQRADAGIDIYVLAREEDGNGRDRTVERRSRGRSRPAGYIAALAAILLATGFGSLLAPAVELTNVVMVFLLAVVGIAMRFGRGPSIFASIVSVAAFDFFFVPPHLTFAVSDSQYLITFAVMLAVALVISTLTVRLREQAETSSHRERRTAALYAFGKDLAKAAARRELLDSALEHLSQVFVSQVLILLPDESGRLQEMASESVTYRFDDREKAVAQWAYDHGAMAGAHTATLPAAKGLYLPMRNAGEILGVIGLHPAGGDRVVEPEQLHLLETFANQLALALARERASS